MTQRGLTILAAITALCLLAALAAVALRPAFTADVSMDRPFLPGLAAQSETLARIDIRVGTETVALVRDDAGQWRVGSAAGYPAARARLSQLVSELSALRLIERKTDREDRLPRLGLAAPGTEGSEAVAIVLSTAQGNVLGDAVLGRAPSIAAGSAGAPPAAIYVRYGPETQAYLAAGSIVLRRSAADWLDKALVDVAEADVLRIDYAPAGGQPVSLYRPDPTRMEFTVADLPEDRVAKPDAARAAATLLNALALTEAVRADTLDWSAPSRTTVTLAGGNSLAIDSIQPADGGAAWFRLTPTLGPAPAADGEPAPLRSALEALGTRADGWAFRLPDHRAGALRRSWDDLTGPKTEG